MKNEAKAAELFAAGMKINAVAKRLGISWADAKKLKTALDGGAAGEAEGPASSVEGQEPAPEQPDGYDLALRIDATSVDVGLDRLTDVEIRSAVRQLDVGYKVLVFEAAMRDRLGVMLAGV